MNVYRIVRADRTELDGKGAAEYPGRWNKENIPCLYTSLTPALAQLEVMANAEDWKIFINVKYVVLRIVFPDERLLVVPDVDLPPDWADAVHSNETQELGTRLLSDPANLAFSIPSAVSTLERNVILNPSATDFEKLISVEEELPFVFDKRLMR